MKYWNGRTIIVLSMMIGFTLIVLQGCATIPEFSDQCAALFEIKTEAQECRNRVDRRDDRRDKRQQEREEMDAFRAACLENGGIPVTDDWRGQLMCVSAAELRRMMNRGRSGYKIE